MVIDISASSPQEAIQKVSDVFSREINQLKAQTHAQNILLHFILATLENQGNFPEGVKKAIKNLAEAMKESVDLPKNSGDERVFEEVLKILETFAAPTGTENRPFELKVVQGEKEN